MKDDNRIGINLRSIIDTTIRNGFIIFEVSRPWASGSGLQSRCLMGISESEWFEFYKECEEKSYLMWFNIHFSDVFPEEVKFMLL